jgi:hypothetical protein
VYAVSGDINSSGEYCDMTCGVKLVFRSLNQITIIAATASAITMMEPIIMPTIAPIGKVLLFPMGQGEGDNWAVELGLLLGVARTELEVVFVVLAVVVGIGP